MHQSRLDSFIEACINTGIGFIVAFMANLILMPLLGIPVSLSQNLMLTAAFTFVSVARSYFIRRVADKWLTPARLWLSAKFTKV